MDTSFIGLIWYVLIQLLSYGVVIGVNILFFMALISIILSVSTWLVNLGATYYEFAKRLHTKIKPNEV